MGNEFSANIALFRGVLLVESATEFPKVFLNQPLLVFRQERTRAGPPEELLEAVKDLFCEFLAAEVPYGKAILEL